mgnify:CR=1 FL=1
MTTKGNRYTHIERIKNKIVFGDIGEHESIYKYVSLDGKQSWNYFERMLEEGILIGSTLSSLNDPLEGSPKIFNDLNDSVYEECCVYFDKDGIRRDEREFSNSIPMENLFKIVQERLDRTKQTARIISFARRSDSHLLWSHYAKSHHGACLHFSLAGFGDPKLAVGSVSYTQNRPVVPLSLLARLTLAPETDHHPEDRTVLRRELYKGLFFTKPQDWSYEEEVRVIYSTTNMTNLKFRKQSLYEIILGAKCPTEVKHRIKSLVSQYAPQVEIRQARLTQDTFSVEIE